MTHYFTLQALSAELDATLRGLRITSAFTQRKDELLISFSNGSTLCTNVNPQSAYCFLNEGATRARRNTVDLFPSILDAAVARIAVLPYDRTIAIELDGGTTLLLRLYATATGNVFLADADHTVTDAFKNRETLQATKLAPGRRFDEAILRDVGAFGDAVRSSTVKTIAASVKQSVPFLGALYTSEVLFRGGVAPTTGVAEADPVTMKMLFTAMRAVIDDVVRPSPRLYQGEVETLSVIPLLHLESVPARLFPSVNNAIRTLVFSSARRRGVSTIQDPLVAKLTAELERKRKSLHALERELHQGSRAEEYERHGKLLMAHLNRIRKGMKHADLDDLYGAGETVRIELDPALSPVQNAEKLFSRARKARTARAEAAERQRSLLAEERILAALHQESAACASAEDLEAFQERNADALRKLKIMPSGSREELPPFRVFSVAGGYEVWVGKSSSNNDLLTMKYAKPHDLWFHARGSSGSHTVLKAPDRSGVIPKEAIREAARIAAYYSKMRNAKTVPVAYCERKYVRKPKGAPPGTVTLEREEVIFVDPRLPAPQP